MDEEQFRKHIIEPTLRLMGLWSFEAESLLLGTAKVESRLEYIKQIGGGPAMGFYQMEPATHDDIFINFLRFREDKEYFIEYKDPCYLMYDMQYATWMARIHYLRVSEPLPPYDDLHKQAKYWKKYYNTKHGKGIIQDYAVANREQ